jgi:hypothetical protein
LDEWSAALLEEKDGRYLKILSERKLDFEYIAGELGNLLGLLEWASEKQRWADVIKLGQAADPYLALNGLWDAWGKVLEQVLLAAQKLNDRAIQAWAYHQLGTRAIGVGGLKEAVGLLVRALRLRIALGDVGGILFTQHNLAIVLPPTPYEPEPPIGSSIASAASQTAQLIIPGIVIGAAVTVATLVLIVFILMRPGLSLSVQANPSTYNTLGQTITYTYTIHNPGFARTSGPVIVVDGKVLVKCPEVDTVGNQDGFLDPSESITCTGVYTITQIDLIDPANPDRKVCSVTNTAIASADNGNFKSQAVVVVISRNDLDCQRDVGPSNPDPEPPAPPVPPTLTASGSPLTYDHVNEEIIFTYVIKNNDNESLTGNITVADSLTKVINCPDINTVGNLDSTLDLNETITCTAIYTITQADIDKGYVANTAKAQVGEVESNPASLTIPGPPPDPQLSLTKTANPIEFNSVEQPIIYTYTVKNEGNVTLSAPSIIDDRINNGAPFICGTEETRLAPGETVSCNATYTISQADFEPKAVTNTATASVLYLVSGVPSGPTVSPQQLSITSPSVTTTIVCPYPPAGWSAYTIIDGDTLSEISGGYKDPKVTTSALQVANCMGSATDIKIGGTLYVPYLTSLEGVLFIDFNSNGSKDAGEPGVPGFKVFLINSSGNTIETTTNSEGYYLFTNLPPGGYYVLGFWETLLGSARKVKIFGVHPSP